MSDKQEKVLFCIEIFNTLNKAKGYVIIRKEGTMTGNKLTSDITFFSSFKEAEKTIKKYQLHYRQILARPKKVLESEIIQVSSSKEDMFFVIGETKDGKKLWIHYDKTNNTYVSKPEIVSACGFSKEKAEEVVVNLQKSFPDMVKEWSTELVDKTNVGEITII